MLLESPDDEVCRAASWLRCDVRRVLVIYKYVSSARGDDILAGERRGEGSGPTNRGNRRIDNTGLKIRPRFDTLQLRLALKIGVVEVHSSEPVARAIRTPRERLRRHQSGDQVPSVGGAQCVSNRGGRELTLNPLERCHFLR